MRAFFRGYSAKGSAAEKKGSKYNPPIQKAGEKYGGEPQVTTGEKTFTMGNSSRKGTNNINTWGVLVVTGEVFLA